jgi:hypothetical protein
MITDEDVVDRMIFEATLRGASGDSWTSETSETSGTSGTSGTSERNAVLSVLCRCILYNKRMFLQILLSKYGSMLEKRLVARALVYTVFLDSANDDSANDDSANDDSANGKPKYMEICWVLMNHLQLPKYGCMDHMNFKLHACACTSYGCMYSYMQHMDSVPFDFDEFLSLQMLRQAACVANNPYMVAYLSSSYQLPVTPMDTWECMINQGCHAFRELLRAKRDMKISQRMMVRYVYNAYTLGLYNVLVFIEFALEHGMIFLGKRLAYKILTKCFSDRTQQVIHLACRIIDRFGSKTIVQTAFSKFIDMHLSSFAVEMVRSSKRLVLKDKHLHMLERHKYWRSHANLEYMIVNRMKLEERKPQRKCPQSAHQSAHKVSK